MKRTLLRWVIPFFLFAIAMVAVGVGLVWAPDKSVQELSVRWASAPSQFANINGMQVHLRDEGPRDDPLPIVLLHGTSASLHTWDGWVSGLKDKRRVIRMDLPAFGLTGPNPQNDYSIAAYVQFVQATLDAMGVKECVLGGNSLGGQIAWASAAALPERVKKLILVDAAGYRFESTSVPIGFRIALTPGLRWIAEKILPRSVVEKSLHSVYGDPSKVSQELVDRYYDLALRAGNRQALGRRFEQRFTSDEAQIAMLKVPTLILWGGQDRLIPPDSARRFAKDIAGSTLVVFDALGHVPHEEDPGATLAPVQTFLADR
jgi:pimeloyl-ACP methyl ester carboxylesterase